MSQSVGMAWATGASSEINPPTKRHLHNASNASARMTLGSHIAFEALVLISKRRPERLRRYFTLFWTRSATGIKND